MSLYYKDQLVSTICRNNRCLLWELYKTYMTTVAFVSVYVNTIKQWSCQFDEHGWYAVMLVLALTIDERVGSTWWPQLNLATSVTRSYDLIWLDGKSHRVFGLANTSSYRHAISTDSLVRSKLSPQAANSHHGAASLHCISVCRKCCMIKTDRLPHC
jgi:hypothetical protein